MSSHNLAATETVLGPQDRRTRIVDGSDAHNRTIIRCIGQISVDGTGTGTIVHYNPHNSTFVVATCGHDIGKWNDDEHTLTLCKSKDIIFNCVETKENKSKVLQSFQVLSYKIPPQYCYFDKSKNHNRKSKEHDLGVLLVWDHNRYYEQQVFTRGTLPQHIISLRNCQEIEDNYKYTDLDYELYGFPVKQNKKSKVINGGLYGMTGFAYLNQERTFYDYTSIDTECAQSGASLFVDLTHFDANGQETIAIVGIHALGASQDGANHAVALNEANLSWMNQADDDDNDNDNENTSQENIKISIDNDNDNENQMY